MTLQRLDLFAWVGRVLSFRSSVVAALAGIALSALAWFAVAGWEERIAASAFAIRASNRTVVLQNGIEDYENVLAAVRALFDATEGSVSRDAFNAFTKALLIDRKAILGLSWVQRVTHGERAAHELAGVRDGIAGYHIKTIGPGGKMLAAPDKDEYFPVFYAREPLGASVYGVDLNDGGVRQQPLVRARDGDHLAASYDFPLQVGVGDREGFILVLPVYRQHVPHASLEERRRNLLGFVEAVFQFDVMAETIMAGVKSPLNIMMYEATAGPGAMPVYVRGSDTEKNRTLPKAEATSTPGHWLTQVTVGDRQWRLVALPESATTFERSSRAWIVFCAGLLMTASVVTYMWNATRNVLRLKAANDSVSALARTDPLTGLANRRAFLEQLARAFASAARGNYFFAVHFVDLDEFKDVNDTQGHETGDLLLKEVAARLTNAVRAEDVVARFGGDEFAVLQVDAADASAAGILAERIVKALAAPYPLNGVEQRVTASIGVAPHSAAVEGPKEMLMQADLALYRAKADGRNCFRFHTGELDQQVHLRVDLAEQLRAGIDRGELELRYQPQVEIRSGEIVGLEAQLRWNHPTRGEIRPSIFVPVAERTGGIAALGQWMLARACTQIREWEDSGIAVPRLAIGVSAAQLRRPEEFECEIAANFKRCGIGRDAIELELTESVMMEVTQKQGDALERLRLIGVTIALDDFGTGYSSLKQLSAYPVRRIKIARDLVAGLPADSRSAIVVRSAIRLAHELGMECIAEGVDRDDQERFLLEAGCEHAQGSHYGPPMQAEGMARELSRKKAKPLRAAVRARP